MTYITFQCHVKEEHLAVFHALASEYHANPARFLDDHKRRLNASQEAAKAQTESPNVGLYKFIIENCTCGKCYNGLARPDRVPWRAEVGPSKNHRKYHITFLNAKHGMFMTSTVCDINDKVNPESPPEGWIYQEENLSLNKEKAKLMKIKAELEEKRLNVEIAEKAAKAEVEKQMFLETQRVNRKREELEDLKRKAVSSALDEIDELEHIGQSKEIIERKTTNVRKGIVRTDVVRKSDKIKAIAPPKPVVAKKEKPKYKSVTLVHPNTKNIWIIPATFQRWYSNTHPQYDGDSDASVIRNTCNYWANLTREQKESWKSLTNAPER
jgi:hypothetical protein